MRNVIIVIIAGVFLVGGVAFGADSPLFFNYVDGRGFELHDGIRVDGDVILPNIEISSNQTNQLIKITDQSKIFSIQSGSDGVLQFLEDGQPMFSFKEGGIETVSFADINGIELRKTAFTASNPVSQVGLNNGIVYFSGTRKADGIRNVVVDAFTGVNIVNLLKYSGSFICSTSPCINFKNVDEVPSSWADGVDNTASLTAGAGIKISNTNISNLTSDITLDFATDQGSVTSVVPRSDHVHHGTTATNVNLYAIPGHRHDQYLVGNCLKVVEKPVIVLMYPSDENYTCPNGTTSHLNGSENGIYCTLNVKFCSK